VYIKDKDLRFVFVNDSYCEFHGKSRAEVLGKTAYDLYPRDQADRATEQDREIFEKGSIVYLSDYSLTDAHGSARALDTIKTPIRGAQGNVTHLVAVSRDVTESKQMQARLIKSERMAAIGELAGMVGHDLRNPLQGILAAAYALKVRLRTSTDEKIRTMLEIVEKDVAYANEIASDLLEYSGEVRLELTYIDQRSLIEDALTSLRLPENIHISNLTGDEPKLRVDATKLKRVYLNLIKNAVEAMPAGGKLTITGEESEGKLRVHFADTGEGMTEEVMEKLWVPLFTTKAKGMGFGLPICKRIVEAHRGTILAESTLGKGSTFTVSLPIK
jgi:PAS domain S-box-containing protein